MNIGFLKKYSKLHMNIMNVLNDPEEFLFSDWNFHLELLTFHEDLRLFTLSAFTPYLDGMCIVHRWATLIPDGDILEAA